MISYNTIKKDKSSTIFRWEGADGGNRGKADQGRSEGFGVEGKGKGKYGSGFGFEKGSEGDLYGRGRGGEGGSQGIMVMGEGEEEEQMKGYWLNNSEDEGEAGERYGGGHS